MKFKKWGLIKFILASESRGNLVAIDFEEQLPFTPKRFFATFNVPSQAVRGQHAHFECDQVLFAIAGEVCILLNDGFSEEEITLNDPSVGLFVPKLTWSTQTSLTPSSVLGVFASHAYEESDYIRSFDRYMELVHQH